MIPLVFIDVDGTLVGPSGTPSEAVWEAAARATARGQHLGIATARPALAQALDWANRLDPAGWHLFQAGSSLLNTGSGEVMNTPLPGGALEVLVAVAAQHDWVVEAYSDSDMVVDSDAPLAVEHAALIGVEHHRRQISSLQGDVVRVQLVVPIGDTEAAREAAPAGTIGRSATSPAQPNVAFVSITAEGCTKAYGIAQIAKRMGLTLEQVAMVGDGNNDAEALAAVGTGIAMGNAEPEAVEAAKFQVGDVTADGLVEALELTAQLF